MVNDWVEKSLADICNLIKRGVTPKYSDEGVLVINQRCIRDQRISLDAARRHDLNLRKISDEKFLQGGDVLINSTGVGTLGRVAQVNNISEKTTVDTHVTIARLGLLSEIDISFFGCILKYKEPVFEAMGEGSTGQTELSRHLVGDVLVRYPKSKDEQKAIAHILGSLDDKIELNRQMNETLEAMAQTLFKSWFVDFDPVIDNALAAGNAIPDEFIERAEQRKAIEKKDNSDIQALFPDEFEFTEEMGWIPRGWEVCRFKQIVEKYIDNRGKTPPLCDSGIPLIEVKHIDDKAIKPSLDTTKFVDRSTYNSWFRSYLQTEDIIISTVGTIGRICMVPKGYEFAIAQNLLGFRFKREKALPSFMYYQMDGFRFKHDVDARLVTTVQASIKRKDLKTIDLLLPSIEVQKAFEMVVNPLIEKQNSSQDIQLAKLRDTLLPKLMSGELRIPDAAALVDEAI